MKALPNFSLFFLLTDTVICSARIIGVITGILSMIKVDSSTIHLSWVLEIGTSIAIIVFGLVGNIGVLLKKQQFSFFCWLNVTGTIANIFVGCWLAMIRSESYNYGPALFTFLISVALVFLLRVSFVICYAIAISKAKKHLIQLMNPA